MAPIGDQLRAARERKGLTLDRVADETNIAKRYLAALEAEDFGVFPGDPYAIGFLRNYAEYLGLSGDELASAFKSMRIQEQPVPIEDLLPRRGPSRLAVLGAAIGGIAVVAAVLLLVVGGGRREAEEGTMADRAPAEYRIEGSPLEKRLYVGDSLVVASGADSYKLLVSRIDDAVTLETPVGASRLMLGEELSLDFDRDGASDIELLVSDLSKKDPGKGTLVRVTPGRAPELAQAAEAGQAAAGAAAAEGPIAAAPQAAAGKSAVIFEGTKSPHPFVVSVAFRGSCLFRYEADKRDRDERYYRKGEALTVNASNSVKLWASNAQSAKLSILASGGKSSELYLGGAGEVAVKRLSWAQTEAGTWALSASDVD